MRSNLFLQTLLNHLPAATYACDAEGLITYFNPKAVELWGREPKLNDPAERFCGSIRLYSPDGTPLEHVHSWMALALRNERSYNAKEFAVERPDGSRVTVLGYVNPIRDEDGRLTGAVNTMVEVDERKESEAAAARLAAIVESSDDAIVSKDLKGVIRSWNQGAENIFGYTAEEAVGQSITLIIPEERLHEEDEILSRLRRGERIEHFTTVRQRKDGGLLDISLTVSPIKDSEGRVLGASKIARDITEARRAQAAVEEQARSLAAINRVAAALAAELDLERLIQSVTDAGRELCRAQFAAFFYSAQAEKESAYEMLGRSGRVPAGFDESFALRSFPDVFGESPAARNSVSDEGTWSGSYVAVPVVPRSGKAVGVLFIGDETDGTFGEQVEQVLSAIANHAATAIDNALLYEEARGLTESLEEKVEQRTADLNALNQELETFNYSVAHDLRGSLRGIDGFSTLIAEESGEELSENTRRYLERIRAGAQRMGQLLDSLLELSKLMRVEVHRKNVDLRDLAQSIIHDLRQWEPERQVEVVIGECPSFMGDRTLMRLAMENLLSNAWKFTRDEPVARIEVGCQEQDGRRVYYVSDNGVGFDSRYSDKLFEPFQRLHAPGTFEGTGIGLANAKRIIEKHGGTIWAASEVGKGATFYFTV